ncbi:MAG: hypothetical protein ACLQB1_23500, partial [Streptosporangiaceae bacterium]
GATGSPVANALAREADVVLGVGTRYSDFTTASRTAFQNPDVRFVNLNVAAFDAGKHAGVALVADARAGLEALTQALGRYHVDGACPTPPISGATCGTWINSAPSAASPSTISHRLGP